ncbi:MAG: T9SS type A sorting domain-containing protein [Sphingobacteriales bacterium]|nr:MAG: T9SS type A sorting domain-containing protein [Sphingobacteriales bacterium]
MKRYLIPFITLFSLKAVAQPAALDTQFGNAGISVYQSTMSAEYNCVVTDAQGNIFSAGYVMVNPDSGYYRLMVTKTLPNGQADQSFGSNGITEITVDASEFPLEVVLAPGGKILVSGSAYTGHTPNAPGDHLGFVVRLNSNGTLDQTFAQGGIFHFMSPDSHFTNIFFRNNGAIVLCGNTNYQSFVLQLQDNGTPDSQFGNNGYFFLNTTAFQFVIWSAVYNEDGSMVLAGNEFSSFDDPKLAYCKVTAQGAYDLSFGDNGYKTLDMYSGQPTQYETLTRIRKGPGGKYYMSGSATSQLMLRVHTDGRIDSTFGVNGVLSHQYPNKDFVLQQDGKMILTGSKEFSEYNAGWVITRLNADGSIDPGFANGQSLGIDISAGHDYLQALKIINDQYLIVAGSSRGNNVANATLAKIKLTGGTGIKDNIAMPQMALYPNPVRDIVTLEADEVMCRFEIVDMSGRQVQQNNFLNAKTARINCAFPAGTYTIRVQLKSGAVYSRPLIRL